MYNLATNGPRIGRIGRICTGFSSKKNIRANPPYPSNPWAICGLIGFLFLIFIIPAKTQSISTLLKNAEQEAKAGHLQTAAELWERAGRLKNSDPDLLYKAAEAYASARDYLRAGDCYNAALNQPQFPLAPLRYARALKQQGRYKEALQTFEAFAVAYKGAYKAVMLTVAENEMAGCELPQQLLENQDTLTLVFPFQGSANTTENEFAPIPFAEQLMYFSLSSGVRTKLMRSIRKQEVWGMPEEANSLPEAVSVSFRTGCFSPDGSRFYYTQCEGGCPAEQGGTVSEAPCAIFCLHRTEEGWAVPERLRAYINLEGSTAMFPHVAQAEGLEYLFFSSNRKGGFGGLDIYVCERSLDSEMLDFSLPQNLGRAVNTGADEITPFYESDAKTLWFSTFGHPSMGGYDIFKTEKVDTAWSKPQNAGAPTNSPADDYFFVLKKNGEGAYLSSNRSAGESKTTTTDDDIFEVKW